MKEARLERGALHIAATAGTLTPQRVAELASAGKTTVRWQEPVAVAVRSPAVGIPGAWYASASRAYVTRLMLGTQALAAAGTDLEVRGFALPQVPKGGAGARVAQAPLRVPGVLAVYPDIFGDAETVVGRKGEVSWKDVLRAFRESGCPGARPQAG
ncbi:MAG: hypothetical protein ACE5JG_05150 [Planctomycetota bacterium]